MKKFILSVVFFTVSIAEVCHTGSSWCFNVSINQSFYMFDEVSLNGFELNEGLLQTDGSVICPDSNCNVVGAFNGDVCVGWSIYYINELDNRFTLAVYGDDGFDYSEGYMLNGQIPHFKIFNTNTNNIVDGNISECYTISGSESNCSFINMSGNIVSSLESEDLTDNMDMNYFPVNYQFKSVYPNPFNPATTILYQVPKSSLVDIITLNLQGEKIESIFKGFVKAGAHSLYWQPMHLNSGIYLIQINFNNKFQQTKKVIFLK